MANVPGGGPPKELPRLLGDYRLIGDLGRNQLGPLALAVYRPTRERVALTVVKPEWACLPKYVARLALNACAASTVVHPNITAVVGLGEAQGRVAIASEHTDGPSLAGRVQGQGALPAREAVVHVLQAARGLRTAHVHGLVHGDVSAERILVDRDGLTRLTGLGLTSTPDSASSAEAHETKGPIALGTQAETDAAAVAPGIREDVRGLGRTLAFLLTGQHLDPADDGTSLVARGVPVNLVDLVRGLIDQRPGQGFTDLGSAIPAFEGFLNARKPGATAPKEEQSRALSELARSFDASPLARLREQVILGSSALWVLLVFLGLLGRKPFLAASLFGLGLMIAAARVVLTGWVRSTPDDLLSNLRGLFFESPTSDRLTGLAAPALLVAALLVAQLFGAWVFLALLALAAAFGLYYLLERPADRERKSAVEEAKALVRQLRLQGVGEESVRALVRTTAAPRWEPLFKTIFDEAATRAAREPSDQSFSNRLRSPWTAVRDALVATISRRRDVLRRERETAFLATVEERGLVANGVNLLTARRRSRRTAAAVATVTAELRAAAHGHAPELPEVSASRSPSITRALREAAETPEVVLVERETGLIGSDPSWLVELLTGPRVRFLLGVLLLAGFLIWVQQNGIISHEQLRDVAARAIEDADPLKSLREAKIDVHVPEVTQPLRLPFLPGFLGACFKGLPPAVSGLILLISAFWRGSRVGLFALPGAALTLFVPLLGPERIGPLTIETAAAIAGAAVALFGLFFGKAAGER